MESSRIEAHIWKEQNLKRPVPAGHNLVSNPTTVAEVKRILEENIVGAR
jgi:hypothetical protein